MADMIPQGVQTEVNHGGYERGDANIRSIFVSAIVVFSTIFVVMLVVAGMSYALNEREDSHDIPLSATFERQVPPEPRLLPSRATGDNDPYDKYPWELGAQEKEAQLKAAITPYYIDRASGRVSISTDQAIALVAAQGLPSRQPQGKDEPRMGEDIGGKNGMSSPAASDANLDGSMVPDTTGGRAMSDLHIQAPSLGETPQNMDTMANDFPNSQTSSGSNSAATTTNAPAMTGAPKNNISAPANVPAPNMAPTGSQ